MTNKSQKILFNKKNLLKAKEITVMDYSGHKQFVNYSALKLAVISELLCFVTDDYFIPIDRITTIKKIIGEENNNKDEECLIIDTYHPNWFTTDEDYKHEED